MNFIEMHNVSQRGYDEVCAFAKKIYWQNLKFNLVNFPDYFFSLKKDDKVVGCIGLNKFIKCPLLLNDEKVVKMIDNDKSVYGEQSVLAAENRQGGMLALIPILLEYSCYAGIDKIIFAASEKPINAAKLIGFEVIDCGPANKNVLPDSEKSNFEIWFRENNPKVGIIEVANAPNISRNFFKKKENQTDLRGELKIFINVKRNDFF